MWPTPAAQSSKSYTELVGMWRQHVSWLDGEWTRRSCGLEAYLQVFRQCLMWGDFTPSLHRSIRRHRRHIGSALAAILHLVKTDRLPSCEHTGRIQPTRSEKPIQPMKCVHLLKSPQFCTVYQSNHKLEVPLLVLAVAMLGGWSALTGCSRAWPCGSAGSVHWRRRVIWTHRR